MSEVRRILMSGDTVGGVWSQCLDLARALAARGVSVLLAAMGGPTTPAQRAEAAEVPRLALVERDLALEWMDDPWEDVGRAGRWLLELEAQFAPDVVHVNGFAHAALPFRAPVLLAAHSSVDSWFRAVRGETMPSRYDRYARETARGLAAARVVVAPSRAMLRALEPTYGPLPHGRVIPNGVFVERHREAPKERFVLAAGRAWDEAKNVAALARVAPELPFPIELAGARPEDGVPEGLRSLGLLGRAAVAERMARAAIFAHPARYEPFGLSVLEAALSGCALVLGDIPSLRELWDGAACFVPPDDDAALASSLEQLMGDENARAEAARAARARATRYSAQAMGRAYLDAYGELHAARQTKAATVARP